MKKTKIMPHETIIRRGGNQIGSYIIICSGNNHWRTWNDKNERQTFMGVCDCKKSR